MATFITIRGEVNEEWIKNDAVAAVSGPMTPEEHAESEAFSYKVRHRPWRPQPITSPLDIGKVGFNTVAR